MEAHKKSELFLPEELTEDEFYRLVFEYLREEIFVSDKNGKILYVNPISATNLGLKVEDMIGRTVEDMVNEGHFSVSSTMEVIKHRKPVNVLQRTKAGRILLACGVPVFEEKTGEILMIISNAKDVDAVNELMHTVESQAEEISKNQEEIKHLKNSMFEDAGFVSRDPMMEELKVTIARISSLDVSVLIQGETGVGKEVVAKSLHRLGSRQNNPFVKINCASIPEQLMESELFGYEEGAFTGASKGGKKGKIELAHKGTLFLDEIGEMPLGLQVKLLDFLQDGTFTKVGGTTRLSVDTRIIAATNRDLKKMSSEGSFRKDLFYRLNVIPIQIPPLRQRPKDVGALAKYFMSKLNTKYRSHKIIEEAACEELLTYCWPGNVRELENVFERAYVMSEGNLVTKNVIRDILYEEVEGAAHNETNFSNLNIMPLKEAKWALEKQLVGKAYEMYHSTYKVAEVLQVDQSTVVKLLHKHKCCP